LNKRKKAEKNLYATKNMGMDGNFTRDFVLPSWGFLSKRNKSTTLRLGQISLFRQGKPHFIHQKTIVMAQFIAKNPNIEVHVSAVQSVVHSMEQGKESRIAILKNNNIDLAKSEWFLQQDWLDAFRTIADQLGNMNLFMIGKAIIENAQFPPIKNLEEGLRSIDVAYHMNHRLHGEVMFDPKTGKMASGIGHYSLKQYDEKERKALMVCNNPYPSEFDRGIITQVVRKFKPAGAREEVTLDLTTESRTTGGESCTYHIKW
jgi:hypothetical protein